MPYRYGFTTVLMANEVNRNRQSPAFSIRIYECIHGVHIAICMDSIQAVNLCHKFPDYY